ncbi:hypothetical protein Zmor_017018 [Zophobas morio]|uniref:Uncharacterized protein n=1 Tax=Zophobas morio TaxID=2755281 RepID=A0AA38I8A3_9CUCU|nr:hypothetical protein Zmor_017018 [Zophobas morio]
MNQSRSNNTKTQKVLMERKQVYADKVVEAFSEKSSVATPSNVNSVGFNEHPCVTSTMIRISVYPVFSTFTRKCVVEIDFRSSEKRRGKCRKADLSRCDVCCNLQFGVSGDFLMCEKLGGFQNFLDKRAASVRFVWLIVDIEK